MTMETWAVHLVYFVLGLFAAGVGLGIAVEMLNKPVTRRPAGSGLSYDERQMAALYVTCGICGATFYATDPAGFFTCARCR